MRGVVRADPPAARPDHGGVEPLHQHRDQDQREDLEHEFAGLDIFSSCRLFVGMTSDVHRKGDVEIGTHFFRWFEMLRRTRRRGRLFRRCRGGRRLACRCAGGASSAAPAGVGSFSAAPSGVGSFAASPVVAGSAGVAAGVSCDSSTVGGAALRKRETCHHEQHAGAQQTPDNSWQHHLTPHNAPAGNRGRHAGCRRSHDRLHAVP